MTEQLSIFSKKASNWFRGGAILMVIASHYAEWWSWFHTMEGTGEWIRLFMTKLGVYGVDIFFLFSGYGLLKSLAGKQVTLWFVLKRILQVYIPYLIVVGITELLSGGFTSLRDFMKYLTGQDYWYMAVLFILYICFMVVYAFIKKKPLRILLLFVLVAGYSYLLYLRGEYDFWYISNIIFILGVVLAEYEQPIYHWLSKYWYILLVLTTALLIPIIRSGMNEEAVSQVLEPWVTVWYQVLATIDFSILLSVLAFRIRWYEPVLQLLGRYSLYLYLGHTFLFMYVVNHLETEMMVRFVISLAATLLICIPVGILISVLMNKLTMKLLSKAEPFKK